eukprot:SAG11_NODE_11885_length_733_cov_1.236593_1_plen_70_part_00
MRRADDDLAVAGAAAEVAEDVADVLGAVAEGANVRVQSAQEMLRAAEQSAAYDALNLPVFETTVTSFRT